ncbi:PREDICTED: E3 ubiquitin-protein ligase MARCH3-like, partial [Priapulus caudatus]|uniref:E3 ubiquitin-protein ligase MARCH3-like n=1 Tax=Priapulus caudatus TaxID=37621 RepID=A0ABM1EFE1_PRICU
HYSVFSEATFCRICHDVDREERLISPCRCTGSIGTVHQSCVEKWLMSSNTDACELCRFHYITQKQTRPFLEWLKEPPSRQDQRHLIGDVVCFLVLAPLASVSAWLCIKGVLHYVQWENQWEAAGLICLTSFLIIIFLVWCCISSHYHYKVFKEWQSKNPIVRVVGICELDSTRNNTHAHNAQEDMIFEEQEESENSYTDNGQRFPATDDVAIGFPSLLGAAANTVPYRDCETEAATEEQAQCSDPLRETLV